MKFCSVSRSSVPRKPFAFRSAYLTSLADDGQKRRLARRQALLLRTWAVLLLFGGGSPGAIGANLSEIYSLAMVNDAQYAGARETHRAALEKSEQARALNRPSLVLSASLRGNRDYSTETDIEAAYGGHSATLSLSQPLFRPQNLIGAQQGDLQILLADQQLAQAAQDLLLRVAKAYFDVLQAQDALASYCAQNDAFALQLAQARRTLEVGTGTITEFNEAQAKHDLSVAQELAGRNDFEVKRRALERIINGAAPPLDRFDEVQRLDPGSADELGSLLERVASESLVVAVARISREVAKLEVKKQDLGSAPTIDLTAQASRSQNVAAPGFLARYNTYQSSIGVEVSFPLYQGGAISSRQREAAANLGKAEADLDNARRQAAFDAQQAFLGVSSGAAQVSALEQALVSAESQVKSTRRGAEVGTRTRLDVLNAEQQLFATRRDLSAARYQTLTAGLQLRAAANALSAGDLKAVDSLLKR